MFFPINLLIKVMKRIGIHLSAKHAFYIQENHRAGTDFHEKECGSFLMTNCHSD